MIFHSEWILLILLAVILLKPEEIPALARTIGKLIKYGKSLWQQVIGEHFISSDINNTAKHPFCVAPQGAKTQPIKD